jgi:hypothetical protein
MKAATDSGNHRSDGNQAGYALTFKLDHSTGADQWDGDHGGCCGD